MSAKFTPIAVYKWPFGEQEVLDFCDDAFADRTPENLQHSHAQLSGLYVIELLLHEKLCIDELQQDPPSARCQSSQVPYDESYWTADGSQYIGHYSKPDRLPVRVVFFLHYFDPNAPLYDADGSAVSLPAPTSFPKRLAQKVQYDRP